jgi:hypothetical protein
VVRLDERKLADGVEQDAEGGFGVAADGGEGTAVQVEPTFRVVAWRGHDGSVRPQDRDLRQASEDGRAPSAGLFGDRHGEFHRRVAAPHFRHRFGDARDLREVGDAA